MERKFPIKEPLPPPGGRNVDAAIQGWLELCDRAYTELTAQGWQRWVFTVGFVDPLGLRLKIGRAALARLKGVHGKDAE